MAKQFPALSEEHLAFIVDQHVFFVGTAAPDGRVNISPKGRQSLRVMGPNRLVWLNLTGSGNETAGHLRALNRMTLMWCGVTARPLILRVYGQATVTHRDEAGWSDLYSHFPPDPGARQIYDVTIDLVQTSCGWAVPFMDFRSERDALKIWAENKGDAGIVAAWADQNRVTIDGLPTGMPE